MSRADARRRARHERLAEKRRASSSSRAEVAARKQKLHDAFLDKHGLRLTMRDKLLLPFKFLLVLAWWPIRIWLPDEQAKSQQRREKHRGNRA